MGLDDTNENLTDHLTSGCEGLQGAGKQQQGNDCLAFPALVTQELNVGCEQLRQRGDDVQAAAAEHHGPVEGLVQSFLQRETGLLGSLKGLLFRSFLGSQGHAVGQKTDLLGGTIKEGPDADQGCEEHDDCIVLVNLRPAGKIGAQKMLTNEIPHDAASTGACEGNADCGAVVRVEPAGKHARGHGVLKNCQADADDDAGSPHALNARPHTIEEVRNRSKNQRAREEDARIDALEQPRSRNRRDGGSDVDAGDVERNIGNLAAEVSCHGTVAKARADEDHRHARKQCDHTGDNDTEMMPSHPLPFNFLSHDSSLEHEKTSQQNDGV